MRIQLAAMSLCLAAAPAPLAAAPRIADLRIGQHGDYDRIVVELEHEADVRWSVEGGADVFHLAARPRLRKQLFATGRRRVGQMALLAAEHGAILRLEARPRRIRAFLLSDPPRLVIDVTDPGPGDFEAPAEVRALHRGSVPDRLATAPVAIAFATPSRGNLAARSPDPAPAGAPLLLEAEEDVAAAEPPERSASALADLTSRALLVPLLAGLGLLLLAAGGLALASAQRRSRPGAKLHSMQAHRGLDLGLEPLAADRLDLLEKRLDEEVRARMQLEEQLAQAREELGSLRDRFAHLRRAADAAS